MTVDRQSMFVEKCGRKLGKEFDIVIVGGGMAGATAALALANLPIKIALVESIEPSNHLSTSYDQRAVALSAASVSIYRSMGLWSQLKPLACAIKNIHISEKGRFGATRINVDDYSVKALGHVIPLDQAGPVLWKAMEAYSNISLFCPAVIKQVSSIVQKTTTAFNENDAVNLVVEHNRPNDENTSIKLETENLQAQLVIAADGTFSNLAKLAKIETTRTSYSQHAIIANITTEKPHNHYAFERFTQHGPLALLPLTQNRMSLVWCQNAEDKQKLMSVNNDQFMSELQQAFGYRLGQILKVGKRVEYPLALHLPQKVFDARLLLIGNAAHTLHPIAGQGFNVGLRDIAALVDHVEDAISLDTKIGSAAFLNHYQQQRQADWTQTITATDSLVRLFSNDFLPLADIRGLVLGLVDKIPFIKNKIALAAMGYSGTSARLTRGLTSAESVEHN